MRSPHTGYYALVVPGYTGHLNPMIVLGRELQRRGHRVALVSPMEAESKARQAGLEFIPIATKEFPNGEWARTTAEMGTLLGWKATRFAGRICARFACGILRELPGIVAREPFDGIVMDQISIGAECVCGAMGMPLAVACSALLMHEESRIPPIIFNWPYRDGLRFRVRNLGAQFLFNQTGWPVLLAVSRYRHQHKLGQMAFNHMSRMPPSLVHVAQTPVFFDFPRNRLPAHFHYTGPWIEPVTNGEAEDFPWSRLDGRPLIYASLGTLQNGIEQIFRIIAEGCAGLDTQLVIALGRRGAVAPGELPGNPVVVGYAPQQALLKRANLVITHAGLNTTLEALSEGLPLVALPIANDQPAVAARIRHHGLGEFIPMRELSAPRLREAVGGVLATKSYREKAERCAEEIGRLNGLAQAAELIEAAFKTRQPVNRKN